MTKFFGSQIVVAEFLYISQCIQHVAELIRVNQRGGVGPQQVLKWPERTAFAPMVNQPDEFLIERHGRPSVFNPCFICGS